MPNSPDESPVVHIVDDDADLGDGLSSVLRSVGMNAKAYRSTQEFIKADDLDAPGCIVLDIRLPGTKGLDFQDELVGLGVRLPVILMTGHGDIFDRPPRTYSRDLTWFYKWVTPRAYRQSDFVQALSPYCLGKPLNGLVLGYGAIPAARIEEGIRRLVSTIRAAR